MFDQLTTLFDSFFMQFLLIANFLAIFIFTFGIMVILGKISGGRFSKILLATVICTLLSIVVPFPMFYLGFNFGSIFSCLAFIYVLIIYKFGFFKVK
jgi:predicted MFS family arabinose efflux permease